MIYTVLHPVYNALHMHLHLVLHMSVGATWFPFQFGTNLHLRRAWVLRSRPLDPLSQRRAYTQNDPNKRTESANMHGSGTGRGKGCGQCCGRGCGHLGGPRTRSLATGGQFLPRGARCKWRGETDGPPVPRCRETVNKATEPEAHRGRREAAVPGRSGSVRGPWEGHKTPLRAPGGPQDGRKTAPSGPPRRVRECSF